MIGDTDEKVRTRIDGLWGGSTPKGRFRQTLSPDGAEAPRIPALPAQTCSITSQIRSPRSIQTPNPEAKLNSTEVTAKIAGRTRALTGADEEMQLTTPELEK